MASAQSWTNFTNSGNSWSTAANWSPGLPAFNTSTVLTFDSTGVFSGGYQTLADGATNYNVNQIVVNGIAATTLVTNNAAGTITFAGTSPTIAINGTASLTLAKGPSTTDVTLTAGGLSIVGGGSGIAALQGTIGGAGNLTINRLAVSPFYLSSIVSIAPGSGAGNNTFVGSLILNNGNLLLDQTNGAPLGTASNPVVVNGGSLQGINTALSIANPITLGGTFNYVGSQNGTFTGTMGGTGNIRIAVNGLATFQNTISALGTITVEGSGSTSAMTLSSTVSLNGTALIASTYAINNSTLTLDNTTANATRLNTGAALNLNDGSLVLTANSAVNAVERVATLNMSGGNQITFNTSATRSGRFTADVMNQLANSTLLITTNNLATLGAAPGTANNNNVFLSNLTAGNNINGVLPYGFAIVSTGSSTVRGALVRYNNANGVVPLDPATDYSLRNPLNFGTQGTTNLLVTNNNGVGISNLTGAITANALLLDTPNFYNMGNSMYGTGSITLTSGVLGVSVSGTTTIPSVVGSVIQPSLVLGATGYIHTQANLVQVGSISGSSGLVKSGTGSMTLLADNSGLSGGITVNQGTLIISAENQLGAAGGNVTLNSGYGGGLTYTPTNQFSPANTTALTVSRSLSLGSNGGTMNVPIGLTLTWNGGVGGNGPFVKSGSGTLVLGNSNTYVGDTVIQAGSLAITNSSALGSSSNTVYLNGGYLQSDASVTIAQTVVQRVNATITIPTIVTNSDMTITGNLGNTQTNMTLVKAGAGNLTLTSNNTFSAGLWVGYATATHFAGTPFAQPGGTLTLAGPSGALSNVNGITLNAGTKLVLDNSAGVATHRASGSLLTMNGVELRVVGNSASAVNEHTGNQFYQSATMNTLSLDQPASGGNGISTNLTIPSTSGVSGSGFNFYRGTNLGSPSPTLDYTTVKVSSFTPTTGIIGLYANSPTAAPQDFATYTAGNGVERFAAYTTLPASGALSTVIYSTTGPLTLAGTQIMGALKMANSQIDLAGFSAGPTGNNVLLSTGAAGQDTITTTTGTPVFGFASGIARISVNESLQIGTAANPVPLIQATGLEKFGPGVLSLSGSTISGNYQITQGTIRMLTNQFSNIGTVSLAPGAALDINGQGTVASPILVSTLMGYGTVNLGSGAIQYGSVSGAFGGGFQGSGTVTILGNQFQTLNGNSPGFTGNVQVGSGAGGFGGLILDANVIPTNGATPGPLGTGTSPIVMGSTSGAGQALLIHTPLVSRIERDISITSGGTGTVTIGSTTLSAGAYTTFTGNISLAASRALVVIGGAQASTVAAPGDTIFSGQISGTGLTGGGSNAISWTGGNISLWGNNTFVGNILINSGRASVMGLGSDTAWGNSSNVVNIPDSTVTGMVRADNGPRTLNNPINYLGATVSSTLGFTGTNDLILNGNINLGTTANSSSRTWEVTNLGTTTINGVVSGNTPFIKEGAGALIFNNPLTVPIFTLQGGVLGFNSSTVTGVSGPVGIGTFNLNGGTLRPLGGARTISNATTIGGGFALEGSNDLTFTANNINLGSANRHITVMGTGVLKFAGTIIGASLSGITKDGPGTLILGNNAAYGSISGTTVLDGKLLVANAGGGGSATGGGFVSVGPAGLLGGNGFISGTVTVNGTLSPGMNTGTSTAVLSINNNVTLGANSNFVVELGSFTGGSPPTAGIDYDQLALTATSSTYTIGANVTLQGVRLAGFTAPFLSAWVIVNNSNTAANSGTGTFAGLPDGAIFSFDGQVFQIRYNVGTFMVDPSGLTTLTPGGSIVIAAVPEPGTWALLGLSMAAAGYVGYRWKRQRQAGMEQDVLEEAMLVE